jgi:tRNA(Ile)-lysidine synthase
MNNRTELTFIDTVRKKDVLPEGSSIIAAVSGGGDSVALLLLLMKFREYMGWNISVLHIDHGTGNGRNTEGKFVRILAQRYKLQFRQRKISIPEKYQSEASFSEARFGIYREESGKNLIATGHTVSDRAETLLLRLFEGSALRGLGGMNYIGIGPVRRPLLDISRQDLRNYLKSREVSWMEDPTNLDTSIRRNLIRLKLVPVLEEYFPGVSKRLSKTSAELSQWSNYTENQALSELDNLSIVSEKDTVINRKAFCSILPVLRLTILWILSGKPRKGRVEFEKTDRWIQSGKRGKHILPGGIEISAEKTLLRLTRQEINSENPWRKSFEKC